MDGRWLSFSSDAGETDTGDQHGSLSHGSDRSGDWRTEARFDDGCLGGDHRDPGHAQVVRTVSRAQGHQPRSQERRAHRDLRSVRFRQVDPDPLHQPAGGAPARHDRGRRHRAHERSQEHRDHPLRSRHGVPALQPVSAPDSARELHARADLGAKAAEGGGRGGRDAISRTGPHPRAGSKVPRPALRGPAAARRDRPFAVHEPTHHALRRTHVGPSTRR